jgi:hypothetical protein
MTGVSKRTQAVLIESIVLLFARAQIVIEGCCRKGPAAGISRKSTLSH